MPERDTGLTGAMRAVLALALLAGAVSAFIADDLLVRSLALCGAALMALLWWMLGRQGARMVSAQSVTRAGTAVEAAASPLASAAEVRPDAAAFIASMGHDLRQPMQAVSLFAAALASQPLSDSARRQVLGIEEAAGQLSLQLEAVFAIARLASGQTLVNAAPVALESVLASAVALRLDDAQDAGLHLRHVPTRRSMHTDATLLARLLDALLGHALRNTQAGGVVLGCRQARERIVIEVWDSGQGVDVGLRGQVFEPGAEYGRAWPDRGLGLVLAHELARALGGALSLRSRPGRGSVWCCELPRRA